MTKRQGNTPTRANVNNKINNNNNNNNNGENDRPTHNHTE